MKKFLKFVFVVFLLLGGGVFSLVFLNDYDEKLNPAFESFFKVDPFDPKDNFRVAWAGIGAPEDVSDIYDYGLNLIETNTQPAEEKILKLQYDESNFHCWAKQSAESVTIPNSQAKKECESTTFPLNELQENKKLIERYLTFYNHKNVSSGDRWTYPNTGAGRTLIGVHKLLFAWWIEQTRRGNGDQAIQLWINDMAFIQRVMQEPYSMVEQAIWMIVYGINVNALPVILENDPSLIPVWRAKLEPILRFELRNPAMWNNYVRGDYVMIKSAFSDIEGQNMKGKKNFYFKVNATKNMYYKWVEDFSDCAKKPYPEIRVCMKHVLNLNDTLAYKTPLKYYNAVGKLLLGGFSKGGELYLNAYDKDAKARAIILYMRAKGEGVGVEMMPQFLGNFDASLHDPMTGKPFRWDATKKSIYWLKNESDSNTRRDLYFEKL
jgi:hypothetical protein